jgi:hypothetical protein
VRLLRLIGNPFGGNINLVNGRAFASALAIV